MKYKVVLFDVDGVLIEEKRLFTQTLEAEYGLKNENMLPFFKGKFKDCKDGKADLKEELSKVISSWGWQGTVDELIEYWLTKGTQVDEQVFAFAKELKKHGLKLFVITTQEKYRGERVRELFCSDDTFDDVFYSAAVGYDKQNQEFWDHVSKNIGDFQKDQVLVVDDDPEVIEAAKEFGFDAHLFISLSGLKESLNE